VFRGGCEVVESFMLEKWGKGTQDMKACLGQASHR
jgi:hypothetical protein